MLSVFVSAVLLSLVFSAIPGAITAEALRRGASAGLRSVLLLRLGALVGSLVWAAAALSGIGVLAQTAAIHWLLALTGALLLLRMAVTSLRAAGSSHAALRASQEARGDFRVGVLIALVSPKQVAFWLGVGGGLALQPGTTLAWDGALLCLAGFSAGHLLFTAGFAVLIAGGRWLVGRSFVRWSHALCGTALAYFGLRLLFDTFGLL